MKKELIALLILILPTMASARGLATGSNSAEFTAAMTDHRGLSANLSYARLTRPRMELGFSISALICRLQKEEYDIPLWQAGASFDLSHILISARHSTLALWGDIHAFAGYECDNMGKSVLDDGAIISSPCRFLWGGMAALRLEVPISSRCALSIRTRGRYLPPSASPVRFEAGIGIRITL